MYSKIWSSNEQTKRRQTMQRIFVLDTSVLIHDPDALEKFGEDSIVIPMTVVEELGILRKDHGLISSAAREALRKIDDFHGNGGGGNGSRLSVLTENGQFKGLSPDDRIVKSAVIRQQEAGETPVILISKDTAVRIKADAYGIQAQDYLTARSCSRNTGGCSALRIIRTA
jgi:PhoH-like ATPase